MASQIFSYDLPNELIAISMVGGSQQEIPTNQMLLAIENIIWHCLQKASCIFYPLTNGLSHLIRVPPLNDRAICLPWNKNFVLTPLGQTVVYGELGKIYKGIRKYPSV